MAGGGYRPPSNVTGIGNRPSSSIVKALDRMDVIDMSNTNMSRDDRVRLGRYAALDQRAGVTATIAAVDSDARILGRCREACDLVVCRSSPPGRIGRGESAIVRIIVVAYSRGP
jgi:hypothetical protein